MCLSPISGVIEFIPLFFVAYDQLVVYPMQTISPIRSPLYVWLSMIPNKQGIIAGSSQSSQFKQIYTITYGDFATNKQSQFFQGPPVLMNKNRLESLFPIEATVTTPVNTTITTVTTILTSTFSQHENHPFTNSS